MIPAQYYETVYLIIVALFSIPLFLTYRNKMVTDLNATSTSGQRAALAFTLLMVIFVGIRPVNDIFVDMPGYYYAMLDHRHEYAPISLSGNYLFTLLMATMSRINTPPQVAIIVLAFINFFFTYTAARKMFPNDTFASMMVFFGAFSTFSYATNGLKAGCAAAFFLCALAHRDNWKVALLYLIAALGFHHSQELTIVAFIICCLYRNSRTYFIFWLICLVLAAAHITFFQQWFAGFTDDHGAGYLLGENIGGKGGFRIDFILYSSVPIIVGAIARAARIVFSKSYSFILNVYTLSNALWLLCMYADFTNRIAFLSWGIYPVVLIYPFLKEDWGRNQYKLFYYSAMGALLFTLLMHFVYYA